MGISSKKCLTALTSDGTKIVAKGKVSTNLADLLSFIFNFMCWFRLFCHGHFWKGILSLHHCMLHALRWWMTFPKLSLLKKLKTKLMQRQLRECESTLQDCLSASQASFVQTQVFKLVRLSLDKNINTQDLDTVHI